MNYFYRLEQFPIRFDYIAILTHADEWGDGFHLSDAACYLRFNDTNRYFTCSLHPSESIATLRVDDKLRLYASARWDDKRGYWEVCRNRLDGEIEWMQLDDWVEWVKGILQLPQAEREMQS